MQVANYRYVSGGGPGLVELPALPDEWDKDLYPYAFIEITVENDGIQPWRLYLSTVPFYWGGITDLYPVKPTAAGSAIVYICNEYADGTHDRNWTRDENKDKTFDADASLWPAIPFWTNTDILSKISGSVYLAASEPVPILAPALDPLSLFMGWKAGNWVARQRGKA